MARIHEQSGTNICESGVNRVLRMAKIFARIKLNI